MRKQGHALESSVPYLQNTIQHLQRDLDKSRESEMELQRAFQIEITKIKTTEGILAQEKRVLEDVRLENERLSEKCVVLNAQHEEFLQKHRTLLDELAAAAHEKDRCEMLEAELTGKNCQLAKLQEHFDKLSVQVTEMEDSGERSQMKAELSRLYSEHEQCTYVIEELQKAKRALDQALQSEIAKVERQNAYYQDCIEKLIIKHKDIRDKMDNDLVELSVEFDDMRSKYAKMRSEHEDLKQNQKYLAGELLAATQMVVDEKMQRLEAATEIDQLAQENSRLTSEKVQTDILRESLKNDVNDLHSKVNEHAQDKKKLQAVIAHLEDVNSQLEMQLETSKEEIKVAQSKVEHCENACKELENSLSDAENCAYMSQEIMEAEKRVFNDSQRMNAELKIEIEKLKQNLTALEFQRLNC
ncbi:hypothetical protein RI129_010619 [Pyrocoelia pectoralis]|uniref:Uncharacterized protein n=1 Tax=Pyrocoelia pectoralis TaxID=417401 RepID=A0AAN7V3N2_9COLE